MKTLLKYLTIILLLLCTGAPAVAQMASADLDLVKPRADVIPHSPEVEAMAKHGVLPVTLYTGMPQISIPIFEIKTPTLSVPFSLSYHYNGNKPGEVASWIGLGWSLQGGGSIAKIIKGQTDGTKNSGNNYEEFVNVNALAWNQEFLFNIATGQIDAEPDLYILNVGNHSCKFIMIKGRAFVFPFQNLKITVHGTGFKMIDEQGNIYLFDDTESTFTKSADIPNHISSWQISQIISADKKDTITYEYTSYSFKQPTTFTESYSINGKAMGFNTDGHKFSSVPVEGDHITALVLSSVTSRYGTLTFHGSATDRLDLPGSTGGKALDQILVRDPGGSFRKDFVLVHDYFGTSSKLMLRETFERGYALEGEVLVPVEEPHYKFEYVSENAIASGYTSSIDYWGFYNGTNNAMLFPEGSFSPSLYPYANRNANMTYSSQGVIKKITYPTGGYSTFEFEQNQSGSRTITSNYTDQTINNYVTYNSADQVTGRTEIFKSFSINKAQTVSFTYGDYDDSGVPTLPVVNIYKGSKFSQPVYSSPLYTGSQFTNTGSVFLEEGNYYFAVTCESTILGTDGPYGTYGVLHYKLYDEINTLADGPGLRIKKISSYDNCNTTTPALIKQYTYNKGIEMTKTAITTGSNLHHQCADYDDVSYMATVRGSLSDMSENQFYYAEVTESTQDVTQTGKTVTTFNTQSSQLLDVKVASETHYKYVNGDFLPVKKTTNEYQVVNKNTFTGFRAYKAIMALPAAENTQYCAFLSSPDATDPRVLTQIYSATDFYALTNDYTTPINTKQMTYNEDGVTYQSNETNYFYDNPEHPFPTRVVTKKSNNDEVTVEMKYPLDYNFNQTDPSCKMPNAINTDFQNTVQNALTIVNNDLATLIAALTPYQPYSPNTTSNQNTFASIVQPYHIRADFQNEVAVANANRTNAFTTYAACLNTSITNSSLEPWQQSVAWMQLNNIVSPVIEKYVTIKKADGKEYLLAATRNEYGILNSTTVEPVAISQTEINSKVLKTTFAADPNSFYKQQLIFTYDQDQNLVSQQKPNDIVVTYLYGYGEKYPVAEIKNATFAEVLAALGLTEAQYIIEASAAVPSSNYLAKIVTLKNNLATALVTTYSFDPLVGMTGTSDVNNLATSYEYDAFGRLVIIKDKDGNVLKKYEYHYQE